MNIEESFKFEYIQGGVQIRVSTGGLIFHNRNIPLNYCPECGKKLGTIFSKVVL